MPVTQTQIDALNDAIASAERQVTNGSQSVTYRSIDDLKAARDDLVKQLQAQNVADGTAQPKPKQTRLYYAGRGYQ
jgi:hypothetical protein